MEWRQTALEAPVEVGQVPEASFARAMLDGPVRIARIRQHAMCSVEPLTEGIGREGRACCLEEKLDVTRRHALAHRDGAETDRRIAGNAALDGCKARRAYAAAAYCPDIIAMRRDCVSNNANFLSVAFGPWRGIASAKRCGFAFRL